MECIPARNQSVYFGCRWSVSLANLRLHLRLLTWFAKLISTMYNFHNSFFHFFCLSVVQTCQYLLSSLDDSFLKETRKKQCSFEKLFCNFQNPCAFNGNRILTSYRCSTSLCSRIDNVFISLSHSPLKIALWVRGYR